MKLESRKVNTSKSPEELFHFLTSAENYQQLMPENTKFEAYDSEKFLFGLKGMPEIKLVIKEKIPYSKVVLGSASDKLSFTLTCDIEQMGEESQAQLFFEGDFNAMMAMMIKGPLNKFLETLATGIEKL
ncbi:orotate phosphoribosyltransferase [Nonlabens spongiae]|uniref:Orotate phosphoribosyltransferase n=1 Tax=Nonlabens spongiae TaxID=331648 RepID=A0A1W6MK86_9FLAO|nr:orotate phosphoribosyltransferase [Nonlabens spongiae]ARN78010.1 orotate phosphoribosyltransferase [Nonlabens spongiae]